MAEPFAKPSKKQMEKALEVYGDPIVYSVVNNVIKNLDTPKEDYAEIQYSNWKRLTRLMFKNFPAILIIEKTYVLAEEVANDTWNNFEVPNLKEEKKSIDPAVEQLKGEVMITDVAKRYGLEVNNNRSKCPFHEGSNPTCLSFNNEKNIFNCFSCQTKGDIITFVRLMEDLNDN